MANTGIRQEAVAVVQGASRGIGFQVAKALLEDQRFGRVFATCRNPETATELHALRSSGASLHILRLDVLDEATVGAAARELRQEADRVDLLVNCSGILHDDNRLWPEKRLSEVDAKAIELAFKINALGPLLVARSFEPLLRASPAARFVALSARVGSIGDNRSGGWYAYRSSKAALNMIIRNLAIEWSRLSNPISCFALHPGTVATELSRPFRKNISANKVFSPSTAADQLLETIYALTSEQSGGFYAYDGKVIEW